MKLTSKARSAVTAMVDLAAFGRDGPVSAVDIAERNTLPIAFLEQILGGLRRAGLVESRRGAGGGFLLSSAAQDISVAAVVQAMDEEIRSTACQPDGEFGCRGTKARCLTHGLWHDLDQKIDGYLAGISLADIVAKAPEGENV